MAITGAAAIAGVAAGVAGVSTTAIVVAGLALTAVGMITKNSVLSKLGGGLSLGAAGAGLASSALSAASTTADATTSAINGASTADAVGAGSQAAGDVAASTTAAATDTGVSVGAPIAADSGVVSSPLADSAGGLQTAASGTGAVAAPVDPATAQAINPASQTSINASLASQSPADQAIAADSSGYGGSAAGTSQSGAANANAVNANAANVNPANVNAPNTVQANISADSSVAPGSQAPAMSAEQSPNATGMTGTGSPMGFDSNSGLDAGTMNGTGNGLQAPSSWLGTTMQSMGNWWSGLTPQSQLAVGQSAAGLLSGIGGGALNMITEDKKMSLAQQEQNFQMANSSGAASVPKVGVMPSYGANPYANANANATPTATPAFQGATPKAGLINSVS